MSERRPAVIALASSLSAGGIVLTTRATAWTDPILWIGVSFLVTGAGIFFWLLVPTYITDKRVRRERREEAELGGRANQRQGLEEIALELGQSSSQLKNELRWGKRGSLFPNSAWTKNQHLVVAAGVRLFVDSAYAATHALDEQTIAASQEDLSEDETRERQEAKRLVDEAAKLIESLRDEVEL